MKHKHAEVLIAIAEGKDVEFYCADMWITATIQDSITNPLTHDHFQWRIKPEPKPDVVKYIVCEFIGDRLLFNVPQITDSGELYPQVKLIFDGENDKVKSAEVLKCD